MSRDLADEPLNIVILGGSFSGLAAAHHFFSDIIDTLRITKAAPKYRVILISPSTHLYWNIGAPRALVSPSWIPRTASFIPIEEGFRKYPSQRFRYIQATATSVDFVGRTVSYQLIHPDAHGRSRSTTVATASSAGGGNRWSTGSRATTSSRNSINQLIPFHALILATGTYTSSPLLSLHGPYENTLAALDDFHAKVAAADSIIIAGGGPSGVETAGQLATYFNRRSFLSRIHMIPSLFAAKKDNNPDDATTPQRYKRAIIAAPRKPKVITLISGNARLLPKLPNKVGDTAEKQLKSLGVHVVHDTRVITSQEVSSTGHDDGTFSGLPTKTRCVLNDTTSIAADLYIAATGVHPNTSYLPPELLDASGYVNTDAYYLRVNGSVGERVFAVGDCANYSKNYVLDVYEAVPVMLHNLRNDLWEYELKLQNPYGGKEEQIDALTDLQYAQNPTDTQLVPITRWGGVGVVYGVRVPSLMVWGMKGRDYRIGKAGWAVKRGGNPYGADSIGR
ncbi:hypothetical protein K402DRAFT_323108 [Aulographum hederae CBS 113979]|uniref:FAD/NAD(P)-binding domain-containing protein n=1 Tax=Aulographum hederae CBS 113979 TaxID=1176131 RepID=A0A6G1HDR8_9PEZI|nr:hypothetical protein K402DRAFT_323108 [Aulographum hederae CBS 113979]